MLSGFLTPDPAIELLERFRQAGRIDGWELSRTHDEVRLRLFLGEHRICHVLPTHLCELAKFDVLVEEAHSALQKLVEAATSAWADGVQR